MNIFSLHFTILKLNRNSITFYFPIKFHVFSSLWKGTLCIDFHFLLFEHLIYSMFHLPYLWLFDNFSYNVGISGELVLMRTKCRPHHWTKISLLVIFICSMISNAGIFSFIFNFGIYTTQIFDFYIISRHMGGGA